MAVSLTPPISHKTAAQQAFDDARVSHDKAMDAADVAEVQQYQQTLRAVQLYGQRSNALLGGIYFRCIDGTFYQLVKP